MDRRLLYRSSRLTVLRAIVILTFGFAVFASWLIQLAPQAEWATATGPRLWWLIPLILLGLAWAPAAATAWLHGRYILEIAVQAGDVEVTTFLLWGRRPRRIAVADMAGAGILSVGELGEAPYLRLQHRPLGIDWILDQQGDFPAGLDALAALAEPAEKP